MTETLRTSEHLLASLRRLPDDELVARLKGLAARERRATALLVAHLAELDTRDVYLRAGYSSLFTYCLDVLALSESEAYNRIEVARTARRFPVILDLLASGEVSLTAVRLLAPHLTPENHLHVLASARGRRKAQIEEIVATLSPRPDVPASVRKLAAAKPAISSPSVETGGPVHSTGERAGAPGDASALARGTRHALPVSAGTVALPTPLSPDRSRYQLTIGGATLEKLRLAKDMLRHVLPSGDDEAVLDRALSALLTELARKNLGVEAKDASPDEEAASSNGPTAAAARAAAPEPRDDRRSQESGAPTPASSRSERASGTCSGTSPARGHLGARGEAPIERARPGSARSALTLAAGVGDPTTRMPLDFAASR